MKEYVHAPRSVQVGSAWATSLVGGTVAFFFWQGLMNRIGDTVALVICLITIMIASRAFQISLRWNAERVLVRNHWKTRALPWGQIREVGAGWMFIGGPRLARVVLFKTDGAPVRSLATYPKRGRLEMLSRLTQEAQSRGIAVNLDPESFLANDTLAEQMAASKKRQQEK